MSQKYEVVISGISGRFPETDSIDEYKKMLYESISPITYDNRKWSAGYRYKLKKENIPHGTGKFKDTTKYDNTVFAVSPFLANQVDIVNRMVLEPSFEAILDAGINPVTLMGANVACYITCGVSEAESVKLTSYVDKLSLIGASKGMLSNRISFALNLTGPSITYYSGITGGFEALTAAYENLLEGRIEAAIVGASASFIDPKVSLNYLLMGVLSADGLSRVFDAQADGYGRSEGVVIMYLQRAEDAKRNYGTLLLCDTIYRGLNPKSVLAFDDGYLEESLREIYASHQDVKPESISFLEMDACGIKLMDEREVRASSRIFCENRKERLLIGSVKSHSGNTEVTSGYLSLLKICLALDSGCIAPNMHFSTPNANIRSLLESKMKVVTEPTQLIGPIAAVNSFSLVGSVGHVVIKQNPRTKKEENTSDTLPRLLILCGRSLKDMEDVVKKIEMEPLNKEFVVMVNDIFKTPLSSHIYRGYTILPAPVNPINAVETIEGENRPIWFVFSGMGSQWNGMGKDLLCLPVFAETVNRCDKVLKPKGIDIYQILTSDDPTLFDDIVNAFVGIITVQIGLVNILDAVGIKPDGIIGHSVGENACAYADGCLNLEQAVLASYARGIASNEAETIKGMMAAIGQGYNQVKDTLPEGIEVACHNSSDNCTLTGPAAQVNEFVEQLQRDKVFARTVNVSNIAYHSRHIRPAAPILLKRLKEVISKPKRRSEKWISTSVPESNWNEPSAQYCSAEYLTNNLVSAVLFEEGCKHIPENAVVVEIAPHGLLQAILKRSLHKLNTNISLTLRSKETNAINFVLSAIGKLFIAGCQPDVNALYPKIEYPVPRGTPSISSVATWDHTQVWKVPETLPERPLSEEPITIKLNKGHEYAFIKTHRIEDRAVIPPSLYLYLTWQFLSVLRKEQLGNSNVIFENVKIYKHLYITINKYRRIMIMIQHGTGSFEVLLENEKNPDNPKVIMTGLIYVPYEKVNITVDESKTQKNAFRISGEDFYKKLEMVGYYLEEGFRLIQELECNNTESSGKIQWNGNWICFLDAVIKMFMYSGDRSKTELLFPTRFRKLTICASVFKILKSGNDVICKKDFVLQKLICKGLDLVNLEFTSNKIQFLGNKNDENNFQALQFISHENPNLQNTASFLSLCLTIAVENIPHISHETESKLNVVSNVHTNEILKDTINRNPLLKSNIVLLDMKHFISGNWTQKKFYFIVVENYNSIQGLQDLLENKVKNLFVLIIASPIDTCFLKDQKLFIEITHQSFTDVSIHLLKKLPESKDYFPTVTVADDLWDIKLAPVLKSKKSHPIILLRNSVELADLSFILSERKQYSDVRFLFIMDNDAPQFSTENPFYKNQILQDLPVLVLRNGQWGSYRQLENDVQQNSFKYLNIFNKHFLEFQLKSVDLKYLYFDSENGCDDVKQMQGCGYGIEFSGVTNCNKCVMGIGYYNPLESLYEPDKLLTWSAPKHWTLEDASTVPLIYAQVYYVLFNLPLRMQDNHTILVNSENLSFTEAMIAVALHHNYKIFATVGSSIEKDLLVTKFPRLDTNYLLNRIDCRFDVQLKLLTKGEGATTVISTIKDWKNLKTALDCVSWFGQYVDVTDRMYDDREEFGLSFFLKSTTVITVPYNTVSLLRLDIKEKKKLHSHVEQGIIDNVVQPLSRTVHKDETVEQVQRFEQPENVKHVQQISRKHCIPNNKVTTKLKCDENHSFIIISGGRKAKLWFELIEWLISRGARKFIVALDNFSVDPKLFHQINRLLIQKKATIILTTSKKTGTVENAANLITEANQIAPLSAVFFVSINPAGTVIKNFDAVCKNEASPPHFVGLFCGGLKECEDRQAKNRSTILIHSEKAIKNLSPILEQIDQILTKFNYGAPCLYNLVDRHKSKLTGAVVSSSVQLCDYLSIDIEKMIYIGQHTTKTAQFVEITSLSRKMSETKHQLPIFVIPSVDASLIKSLTRKLIYPTFCATFTETCESTYEIAKQLMKHLEKIQPLGPVTIIGETWSGAIAIELASLVQAVNRKVELFLIEGTPFTWQKYIQGLGDVNTSQFNNNFLKEILNVSAKDNVILERQIKNCDWKEFLDKSIKNFKCSTQDEENLKKVINGIRSRFIVTVKHQPSEHLLNHIVLFKRTPSESSMEKYCFSDEVYVFEEDQYDKFLSSRKMIDIISKYTLFSWDS